MGFCFCERLRFQDGQEALKNKSYPSFTRAAVKQWVYTTRAEMCNYFTAASRRR